MDLQVVTLSDITQRMTNTLWYHLCVKTKNKKKDTNELIHKTEIDYKEKELNVTKGKAEGDG